MNETNTQAYSDHRRPWRRVAVWAFAIFTIAKTEGAYPAPPPQPGGSNVNNCRTSASDFEAGIKQLSEGVMERTKIPAEFFDRYFAGCSLEAAHELLSRSGYNPGELDPKSNNSERKKGTRRLVVAEKNIRSLSLHPSLNCRIILRIDQADELRVEGFFLLGRTVIRRRGLFYPAGARNGWNRRPCLLRLHEKLIRRISVA
jgi:hypothetical protein